MSRKLLIGATVLAGAVGVTGVAVAQPVTGLYIGAVGGANFKQQEQVRLAVPGVPGAAYGSAGFKTGYVGIGSVGYGLGNGLRLEIEGNYRHNDYGRGSTGTGINAREEKYGAMANALFDLDIGSPYVYPYVGAGVGYARIDQRASFALPPFSGRIDRGDNGFAYQAIAGLSFPVPPVVGLSLVAEYRYYAVAGDHSYAIPVSPGVSAQYKTRGDYNHALMLGLHYAFNVVPPPVAAPAPAAVPAAEAARTYLVFFDWDRADLTPRARQVVAEAATATTRTQVTRIEVNGYTDTSGTPTYNQGLSVRRAQSVANELVRDGVPKAAISIQGFGQTRLLVPTAAGVREPQNRRVEIILR